jgi:hypothetical protein
MSEFKSTRKSTRTSVVKARQVRESSEQKIYNRGLQQGRNDGDDAFGEYYYDPDYHPIGDANAIYAQAFKVYLNDRLSIKEAKHEKWREGYHDGFREAWLSNIR